MLQSKGEQPKATRIDLFLFFSRIYVKFLRLFTLKYLLFQGTICHERHAICLTYFFFDFVIEHSHDTKSWFSCYFDYLNMWLVVWHNTRTFPINYLLCFSPTKWVNLIHSKTIRSKPTFSRTRNFLFLYFFSHSLLWFLCTQTLLRRKNRLRRLR